MLKLFTIITITAGLVLGLSACTQNAYVNAETNKLIGSVIGGALDPSSTKESAADILKQCAALQARVSACRTLQQGAEECINNVKTQSGFADKCVL